jgi:hypothetical protein
MCEKFPADQPWFSLTLPRLAPLPLNLLTARWYTSTQVHTCINQTTCKNPKNEIVSAATEPREYRNLQ